MKNAFVASTLALSLSCGIAFAQTPSTTQEPAPAAHPLRHAPNPERQTARLTRKLNLTPDQSAKIEPVLAAQDQQMQAVWQNQQLSREDRHQQMKSIHEQTEQQLSGILTPDQMTQLKAMHHHGHHHDEAGAAAGQTPSA